MSSYVELRARRLLVPWDEDTPDARGFWNYVKEHYRRCIELAWEIALPTAGNEQAVILTLQVILDKLASPLVYLWDSWTVMAPEKKAKYNPELKEIHEKVQKQVEEAFRRESQNA